MFYNFYFVFPILSAISLNAIASLTTSTPSNVTNIQQKAINATEKHDNNDKLARHETPKLAYSDSGLVQLPVDTPLSPPLGKSSTNNNKNENTHIRRVTNTSYIPDVKPISGESDVTHNTTLDTKASQIASLPSNATHPTVTTPVNITKTNINNSSTIISTTTTTSPEPMKPTATYSVEDDPALKEELLQMSKDASSNSNFKNLNSREDGPMTLQIIERSHDGRQYIVPIVGGIFAIPVLVIIGNSLRRRLRDYWSKRKYRRMDFLIEEMYN